MDNLAQYVEQFRIEEFKALRSEILYQIQDIDQIKFWVAAAMAAYYSFIAAKLLVAKNNRISFSGPLWIWGAPAVLPFLALLRLRSHISQLNIFSEYIQKIEDHYPGLPGWEHFYQQHRSEDTVWNYDEAYFVVLIIFAFALLFIRYQYSKHEPR